MKINFNLKDKFPNIEFIYDNKVVIVRYWWGLKFDKIIIYNNMESNNISTIITIAAKSWLKRWRHKLFDCPTFWKSVWNTITKSDPFYRCRECNKAMHCYWDGNDTDKGIDFCNKCASKH